MTNSGIIILQKISRIVEDNIENPNFSIDDLCDKTALSRSQLFRIVKEQTGLSISRYIRRCRLVKGKNLLETTDRKIAEIAYQVGFDSPQTFSKYFTEDFGVSPNEYRKNNEKPPPAAIAPPEEMPVAEVSPLPPPVPSSQGTPNYRFVLSVLFVIAVAGAGFYFWQNRPGDEQKQIDNPENSIAVLPFKSTGDPEAALLADGITDQIHASLAALSYLKVISENSSELFRATKKTTPQIAFELRVGYVVSGTATRIGQQLRIRAELVRAAEDRVVWTKQYEGKANEVMAFIDRISQDITKHFYQKTSGAAVFQSTRMPTENPEAYNEYLQGRQLLATRNKEKMLAGLAKFDQALTLDPDFADAYASKAAIYFSLGNLNHINTDSAFRLTEREALKAIRFDENNASAYGLMAAVYRDEYRWEQANTTFQIALRCNPNNAEVNYWYSLMLRSVGLLEEAVTYSTKAVTLDPLSPVILSGHLRNCSYADKTALVKEILRKGELLFSDSFLFFWSAGYHYLHLNDYSRARRELIIARQLNPNVKGISAAVAYTQARMGESAAAKAYLRSLPATADNDTYFAMVYAGLNDRENCLRTLERMATAGKLPIDVKVSPFFRLLHHDPRFKALLQRFGLLNFQIPE